MKPKYTKPTINSFPVANAVAGDFETLGVCHTGWSVGTGGGACVGGDYPQSTSGCMVGSSDSVMVYSCYYGLNPSDGITPPCAAGGML